MSATTRYAEVAIQQAWQQLRALQLLFEMFAEDSSSKGNELESTITEVVIYRGVF